MGLVHPGNRLVLVITVLKLLLVEIAVKCVPLFKLRVPSSSVPSVDMALDDIGSNCTLKPANRDTVWRQTGEVEWKFRVVQDANWNSNFRATFQRLTISIEACANVVFFWR